MKELEVEAVQTGNLLRSMEINECVAAKSHNKSYSRVEEMKDNLSEVSDLSLVWVWAEIWAVIIFEKFRPVENGPKRQDIFIP